MNFSSGDTPYWEFDADEMKHSHLIWEFWMKCSTMGEAILGIVSGVLILTLMCFETKFPIYFYLSQIEVFFSSGENL